MFTTHSQTPEQADAVARAARQVDDARRAEEERRARSLYAVMDATIKKDAMTSEAVRRTEGSTAKLEAAYTSIHSTAKPGSPVTIYEEARLAAEAHHIELFPTMLEAVLEQDARDAAAKPIKTDDDLHRAAYPSMFPKVRTI